MAADELELWGWWAELLLKCCVFLAVTLSAAEWRQNSMRMSSRREQWMHISWVSSAVCLKT